MGHGPSGTHRGGASAHRSRGKITLATSAASMGLEGVQARCDPLEEQQFKQVNDSMLISKTVVDSYVRQFQVGKKGWIDVLNSQRDRLTAQYAVVDVESPMESAGLKLLLISGRIRAGNLVADNEK